MNITASDKHMNNQKYFVWGLILILIGIASCCFLIPTFHLIDITPVYDLQPDWSSNGQSIVFTCYRPPMEIKIDLIGLIEPKRYYGDIPHKPQTAEICSMAPDGSQRKQLTYNHVQDNEPIWSPDSTQIAFISDRDGWRGLYIMNANGSQQRRVSRTEGVRDLTWSPDSKHIVFSSIGNEGTHSIHILNLEINSERQLVQKQARYPTWSPDGKTIAFVTEVTETGKKCEIGVIQVDTGNEIVPPIKAADCKKPTWSSDSTKLAFVASQNDQGNSNLIELDFQTLETYTLTTDSEGVVSNLVWSPVGNAIFYQAEGEIFAVQADGSGSKQITNLNGTVFGFRGDQNLALFPDGKQIVFLRSESTVVPSDRVRIWKINSDGSNLRRLSP